MKHSKTAFLRVLILVLCLSLSLGLVLTGCTQPAQNSSVPTQGTSENPAPSLSPNADPAIAPTDPNCVHTDKDGDGYCDACFGSVAITLHFYAVNDLHGKFSQENSPDGVESLTTYFQNAGPSAVILSSGDMWQGGSESNLTKGAIITEWMNKAGFVSMTLGNHEFDWGAEHIQENQKLAEFPFLAINILDKATGKRVDYVQPSVMVERSGVKIGIIGAIGDCHSSIAGDKVADVEFATGYALANLVKEESERLRSQGAQVIIYSIHDGYGQNISSANVELNKSQISAFYDTSLSEGGYVDLVFEAHTHRHYIYQDEFGVYHLQGGGENAGVSYADVTIDLLSGEVTVSNPKFLPHSAYEGSDPSPIVGELLEKYGEQVSVGSTELGFNSSQRDGDYLRRLIAKLYYQAAQERWGDQYQIVLGGGFLSVRDPYNLAPGVVQYADLQALFPFDNQLVLCSIKGDSLRKNFFETQNDRYFIYYEDYGQEVKASLDPDKTYYIVTDTYSSGYERNQLTVVEEYDPDVFARDLLAIYISQGNFGTAPSSDYTLTDLGEILKIGEALGANQSSEKAYYVQGTVVSVENATYGNLTIRDEQGRELYIYGVSDATGANRYDAMANPPKVGDTVVLYGSIQKYVPRGGDPIIEMTGALCIQP